MGETTTTCLRTTFTAPSSNSVFSGAPTGLTAWELHSRPSICTSNLDSLQSHMRTPMHKKRKISESTLLLDRKEWQRTLCRLRTEARNLFGQSGAPRKLMLPFTLRFTLAFIWVHVLRVVCGNGASTRLQCDWRILLRVSGFEW